MQRGGLILFFLVCCLFFNTAILKGQDSIISVSQPQTIDVSYLEDQFYVGIGYNFLTDLPSDDVIQRNLSYNLQLGVIKDIPLNQRRNFGLGIGIGYSTNSYYSNIIAQESTEGISYRFPIADEGLNRSKFETHGIVFPFELRFRTSTPSDYKFWRIYTGFRAEYLFSRTSKLVTDKSISFQNDDVSNWQYGLTLNFGYNTWNIHLYYSLNSLLEGTTLFEGELFEIRPLSVGVIFYIL